MGRWVVIVGLVIAAAGDASAQQRTMNQGTDGLLRTWPEVGRWAVLLGRTDGELAYAMITGVKNAQTGDFYLWGLRNRGGQAAIMLTDRNPEAVVGETIRVSFDGVIAATYTVSIRKTAAGLHSIAAPIDQSEYGRLGRLLQMAGGISYNTGTATYSAPLAGAAQAFDYLSQCVAEVEHLKAQ